MSESDKFKLSFAKLSMLERERRVKKTAHFIIGACVDKNKLQTQQESYLLGNVELAAEINMFFHLVKNQIQTIMNINFETNISENTTIISPPPLLINHSHPTVNALKLNNENLLFKIAISILGEGIPSNF